MADFKPTGSPDGPLAKATDWLTVKLDGKTYRRETNTMPQWAGSCWYYLRYIDAKNPQAFADAGKLNHWLPVDLYVGGAEHAVLHLLYSRFWHKVLFDRGYVNCPEPFHKLVNQGMILGEYEYHVSKAVFDARKAELDALGIVGTYCDNDDNESGSYALNFVLSLPEVMLEKVKGRTLIKGTDIEVSGKAEKMSKSRGNVINPDDVVKEYGADSLRLYEMFMGPLEATKPWNMKGVEGVSRFLARVWRLMIDDTAETVKLNATVQDAEPDKETLRELHRCIKKVTEDTDGMRFNTAISAMMEFSNHMTKQEVRPKSVLTPFVLLLAPYAPHVAEELWAALGNTTTLAYEPWPKFDPALTKADSIEIPVQVNGKLKAKLMVPAETDAAGLEAAALADEGVKAALGGKTPKKVIVVPKKLVNLVV
jgi:leucyl-tRNA synthetase